MRRFMIASFFAIAFPFQARSATIHVPTDQPTIQAGIDAASAVGDTVLVAPGTYTGIENKNLNLKGKSVVLRSSEGADSTVIDCETEGRGFYFQAGEEASTVVQGFTVRNGRAIGAFPDGWGGGMLCLGSSPTIIECVFVSNNANNGSGAGIACYDSSVRLVNCILRENTSVSGLGGGGYIRLSSPQFDHCSIELNQAGAGGGIYSHESSAEFVDCVIGANSVLNGDGGGAYFNASLGVFQGCTISNNLAGRGGGVFILETPSPSFSECIIILNQANSFGGGLFSVSGSPSLNSCTMDGNIASTGGGVYLCCSNSSPVIEGSIFKNNRANGRGGAVACQSFIEPLISQCVFVDNMGDDGAALSSESGSRPRLSNCTLYRSSGSSTVFVSSDTVFVDRSILSFTSFGDVISCVGTGGAVLTCTDIYANLGGNWTGCISDQVGQNGNFSANPLFCDAAGGDFSIRATSPCAPANSPPGCDLIGALPVGCGVADVATEEAPSAELRLTVMPNPVRGVARFEFGSGSPLTTLSIFDSQGRLIEQLSKQDGHWRWTPGSAVPAGVYFAMPEPAAGGAAVKFLYIR